MSLISGERWTPAPREQTERRWSTKETLSLSRQQRNQQSRCVVNTASQGLGGETLRQSDRTTSDVRQLDTWQHDISDSNSGNGTDIMNDNLHTGSWLLASNPDRCHATSEVSSALLESFLPSTTLNNSSASGQLSKGKRAVGGRNTSLAPPSLASYPDWAQRCDLIHAALEPGAAHLTKRDIQRGKDLPQYRILAAAKVGCLVCIRECLRDGISIKSSTISGWNVWDSVHFTSNARTPVILRYVEEAGGYMSQQYALWLVKNR